MATEIYNGVYLAEGGLNDLLAYPPSLPVKKNSWFEWDGAEVYIPELRAGKHIATISVVAKDIAQIRAFEEYLLAGNRVLRLPPYPDSVEVRLLRTRNEYLAEGLFHLYRLEVEVINSSYPSKDEVITKYPIAVSNDFTLDGVPFTSYGVRVLEGSLQNLIGDREVRYTLKGQTDTKRKEYRATLNCIITSKSAEQFWRNRRAFLQALTRAGERSIKAQATGREYKCYYLSCDTVDFYHTQTYWWTFTIDIEVTKVI